MLISPSRWRSRSASSSTCSEWRKSILGIIFAFLALSREPAPPLSERRSWGKVAITLGIIHVVLMHTLILLNIDKIRAALQLLMTLQEGK
jgi:hypothetical protein